MARVVGLTHPRFLENIRNYFPTPVRIEENVPSVDPLTGQPIESWESVPGLERIFASYNPNFIGHIKFLQEFRVYSTRTTIYLNGYYPQVTDNMRIRDLDTDETLLIRDVDPNSQRLFTILVTFDSMQ